MYFVLFWIAVAEDFGQEGFYNYDYNQQQSTGYDMGGNNFGQEP